MASYTEVMQSVREIWLPQDFDATLNKIKGRKNGLDLVNNGAKHLPYRPWGVNPDGSLSLGGSGSNIVGPSTNVAGDLDAAGSISLSDWTPAASEAAVIGKYDGAGVQRSWKLTIRSDGIPQYIAKVGGTLRTANVSPALGLADGAKKWVRVTHEIAIGRVRIYVSDNGTAWTLHGEATITAGAIEASTERITIGGPTGAFVGRAFAGWVKDGIDGPKIADFDASKINTHHGPFYNDGLGNQWYGLGSAAWGDHLNFPGISDNYVSTPDREEFTISESFTVEWTANFEAPVPGSYQSMGQKNSGGTSGWMAYLSPQSGSMRLYVAGTDSGTIFLSGFTTGVPQTHRLTCVLATGQVTVERFEGDAWVVVGTDNIGAQVTQTPTGDFVIGGVPYTVTTNPMKGKFYRLKYKVDGVERADVRFDKPLKWNNGQYTDPQGNVWTINRSALQNRLKVVPNSHVELFGVAGDRIDTPDANELDIASDLDLRWKGTLTNWSAVSAEVTLLGKWNSSGNQRSYLLVVNTAEKPRLYLSPDGISTLVADCTVATGLADNALKWVRATWRQSDGRVQFFLSDDGIAWTQLGADVIVNAAGALYASANTLAIGHWGTITSPLAGKVYEAQVWKGIPGVSTSARLVANPKFTALTSYAPYKEPSYLAHNATSAGTSGGAGGGLSGQIASEDMDIRAKFSMDDGTRQAGYGTYSPLAGHFKGNSENYFLSVHPTLLLPQFSWWDGSVVQLATGATALSAIPGWHYGMRVWLRATFDGDNGAGGYTVKFYWSLDGVAWTQLGADVVGVGISTIAYRGGEQFRIGANGNNFYHRGASFQGSIRTVIDGPTPIISWNFENLDDGATSYTTPEGMVITPGANTRIERRTWSFTRASLSPRAELRTGRYAYLPGVLQNYLQLSSGDSTEVKIPGDIDIRACVSKIVPGTSQMLIGRYRSTTATRSYALVITSTGALQLTYGDGTTLYTATSASALDTDQKIHLRGTLDVDDGAGNRVVKLYTSLDGVTWTTILDSTIAGTIELNHTNTDRLVVGSNYLSTQFPVNGNIHSVELRDGINGTIVAAFDLADAMLMPVEPHNGFTDLYGNVWTVNRATAIDAYRTAVVDRSLMLFDGVDDWMEAADNALLDVGTGSFTVVAVFRMHIKSGASAQRIVAKSGGGLVGWRVYIGTDGFPSSWIGDGAIIFATTPAGGIPTGQTTRLALVRDTVEDRLWHSVNGTLGPKATDTTTGTLDNAQVLEVGRVGGASETASMELLGIALVGAAVTDADLAQLFDPDLELSIGPVGDAPTSEEFSGQVTVADDFTVPGRPGWSVSGGWGGVSGAGEMVQTQDASDGYFFQSIATPDRWAMEMDCMTPIHSGSSANTGIIFMAGANAAADHIRFILSSSLAGATLAKRLSGSTTTLVPSIPIPGTAPMMVHRLRVEYNKLTGQLLGFIDGAPAFDYTLTADERALYEPATRFGAYAGATTTPTAELWASMRWRRFRFYDLTKNAGTITPQMRMAGIGNVPTGESFGYPDYLKHGEFFADDFPEPDGPLPLVQWAAPAGNNGADFRLVGNRLRLGELSGNHVVVHPVMADYKNVDYLSKIRKVGVAGFLHVVLRSDGEKNSSGHPQNGYSVYFRSSSSIVVVYKWVDGIGTALVTLSNIANDTDWWVRFRVVSNFVYLKLWTGAEPATWSFVAFDDSLQSPGKVAFIGDLSGVVTNYFDIDNIRIADVQGMDLIGGIPSAESVGGFSRMLMKMTGVNVPDSYVAPSLHQVQQFIRDVGSIDTSENVGGLDRLNMRVMGLGDIASEEMVWGEKDERIAFEPPYVITMEALDT